MFKPMDYSGFSLYNSQIQDLTNNSKYYLDVYIIQNNIESYNLIEIAKGIMRKLFCKYNYNYKKTIIQNPRNRNTLINYILEILLKQTKYNNIIIRSIFFNI